MSPQSKHRTDEDFAELLAGPKTEVVLTAETDAEVLQMESALRAYRVEALQWAERRSSVQPSLVPAARRSTLWASLPQWSLAAVAAISIAAGVTHLVENHRDSNDVADVSVATVLPAAKQSSPAQIAADNRLLSSIDSALSYHSASPVDALNLKPEAHGAHRDNSSEITD